MHRDDELIGRVRQSAPGCYTERDGGDWYVIGPGETRLAEGFATRRSAHECLLWLAGDPVGAGFLIERRSDLFCEVRSRRNGEISTVWAKEAMRAFPSARALLGVADQAMPGVEDVGRAPAM